MTASNATYDLRTVPTASLVPPAKNPNSMRLDEYKLLVEAIRKVGFLQPILVREDQGKLVIVDGAHRRKAALEVGLASVPVLVGDFSTDDDLPAIVQIAMNRLRGTLDLAAVAATVTNLADEGWTTSQLAITGFSADEVSDLIATVRSRDVDVMNSPVSEPEAEQPEADESAKTHALELLFKTRSDLTKAKRALKKASKTGDLVEGLFALIDPS